MARFFFHVHDDVDAPDDEGLELLDVAAAETEAIRGVRALASEQISHGKLNLSHFIEVVDETGSLVRTVSFGDAIELTR